MAKNKRKYIYIPIIMLFVVGLFYAHNLAQSYIDKITKVRYTLVFQDRETYNYFIEHIKQHSSDTLNIDTTNINYINTEENEENKGTEENSRKAKGTI